LGNYTTRNLSMVVKKPKSPRRRWIAWAFCRFTLSGHVGVVKNPPTLNSSGEISLFVVRMGENFTGP
jgi:hypothetical protein